MCLFCMCGCVPFVGDLDLRKIDEPKSLLCVCFACVVVCNHGPCLDFAHGVFACERLRLKMLEARSWTLS